MEKNAMDGKLRNMTAMYLFREDQVLLLFRQNGSVVNDVWTGSAGGHFEQAELNDARGCVLRELQEELGLGEEDIENLTLRYITLRNTSGEIRQNYYFFADLKSTVNRDLPSNEGITQWFHIDEISKLKMPYTAQYVMKHYCNIGRFTKDLYAGAADGKEVVFTAMPEF